MPRSKWHASSSSMSGSDSESAAADRRRRRLRLRVGLASRSPPTRSPSPSLLPRVAILTPSLGLLLLFINSYPIIIRPSNMSHPWVCTHCSFLNPGPRPTCEACELPPPDAPSAPATPTSAPPASPLPTARELAAERLERLARKQATPPTTNIGSASISAPYPSLPVGSLVGTRIPFAELEWAPAHGGGRFLLGAGRAAAVYAATLRGEPVAVKVVPAASLGPSGARKFWHEVDLSVALNHERLVRALGAAVAVDSTGAPSELCLVMAHEAGGDAGVWAASDEGRAASLGTRLRVVADVALALRFLHARGVAHGSVKPSNVLLSRTDPPRAVLGDLGHARALAPRIHAIGRSLGGSDASPSSSAGGGGSTGGGGSLGGASSPVAPADASYVDPSFSRATLSAADVFAFAVSAWELLAGARAFVGGNIASMLARGDRPSIDALPVEVRAELGPLLIRSWSADVAARPTAVELAAAFDAAATRELRVISFPSVGGASLSGDAFSCGICIGPMRNPSTAACGGHNFCRDCLCRVIWTQNRDGSSGDAPKCPVCRLAIQKRPEEVKINTLLRDLLATRLPPRAVDAERVNSQGRKAQHLDGNYFCGASLSSVGGFWSRCRICTSSTCSPGCCNCNACHELDVAESLPPTIEWHDEHRRVEESREPTLHPSHTGHYRDHAAMLRFPGAFPIRKVCSDGNEGPACTHRASVLGGTPYSHWSCCQVRGPNEPCTGAFDPRVPPVIHASHTGHFRRVTTQERFPGAAPISKWCSLNGDEGEPCSHGTDVIRRDHMSCCGVEDSTSPCQPPARVEPASDDAQPSHPSHTGSWRWVRRSPPLVVFADGRTEEIAKYCEFEHDGTERGPGDFCTHEPAGLMMKRNHFSCCGVKDRGAPCPRAAAAEARPLIAPRAQNSDGVAAVLKAGHYYCLRENIPAWDASGDRITCRSTAGAGSDGRNCAACNALDESTGLGAARWHSAILRCGCELHHNESFPIEGAHKLGMCSWSCCGKDWRSTTCVGVPASAGPQARAAAVAANMNLSPLLSAACDDACTNQHPRGICFVCGEGSTFHRNHVCASGTRGKFPIEVGCGEACNSRHDGAVCLRCGESYGFHRMHSCIIHADGRPVGIGGRGTFPVGTESQDEQDPLQALAAQAAVNPELAARMERDMGRCQQQ